MSVWDRDPFAAEMMGLDDPASERADSSAERVLSLANVAKMFRVPQLTLRFYELRGLIRRRHTLGGLRVYGWADCERLAFIIKCRNAGLTLSDVTAVIEATDDDVSPLKFKTGHETCMALVERLEGRRKVIDDALAELSHVYALLTSRLLGETKPHD
jgi:DNA-binding transcriptional MerR regulator